MICGQSKFQVLLMAKNDPQYDHLIQAFLVDICKEEPYDVNSFMRRFAHF